MKRAEQWLLFRLQLWLDNCSCKVEKMTRMAADSLARLSCPAVDLTTQHIHSVTVQAPFTRMLPDIEFSGKLRHGSPMIQSKGDWGWSISEHLRANFCKYRESGDSLKIFNFFIFCPNKAFNKLFSKIQLKDTKALEFFQNRGKFENRPFGLPPSLKIDKNDAFSFRSCW